MSTSIKHLFAYLLVVSLFTMGIVSCKKKDNETTGGQQQGNTTLATAPDAIAEENDKSGGVYKGVLVGSTGYIKITLQNGVQSVEVTMNGVTKTLDMVSFAPQNWVSGQAVTQAVFEKDNWQVSFSVDADGSNPNVSVVIPGHTNIVATISKETSVTQVKSFEGTITYNGTSTNSAFNFVISGQLLVGLGRMPDENTTHSMVGTVSNGTKIQGHINNATIEGTINGDDATGTIVTPNATATWNVKRTL